MDMAADTHLPLKVRLAVDALTAALPKFTT
jgi:hypothetical protein